MEMLCNGHVRATSKIKASVSLATKRSFVNKMEGKENIEGKFLINKAGALRLRRRSETLRAGGCIFMHCLPMATKWM